MYSTLDAIIEKSNMDNVSRAAARERMGQPHESTRDYVNSLIEENLQEFKYGFIQPNTGRFNIDLNQYIQKEDMGKALPCISLSWWLIAPIIFVPICLVLILILQIINLRR
jgi:hypothetical protein